MIVIITKIEVDWGQTFLGYVPSKKIFQAGGLYTCKPQFPSLEPTRSRFSVSAIGIVGATVMPHGLFVGSALATQDRLSPTPPNHSLPNSSLSSLSEQRRPAGVLNHIKSSLNGALQIKAIDGHRTRPQKHEDRENNSYEFVKSHLYNGVTDVVLSLLGIAVVINSM